VKGIGVIVPMTAVKCTGMKSADSAGVEPAAVKPAKSAGVEAAKSAAVEATAVKSAKSTVKPAAASMGCIGEIGLEEESRAQHCGCNTDDTPPFSGPSLVTYFVSHDRSSFRKPRGHFLQPRRLVLRADMCC
jgi:hypothetical protein